MSSQDKLVIVDSKKVLIRPIIALPLSASILFCFFAHMLKVWEKNAKTLIVTNGNGFCQEKFHLWINYIIWPWVVRQEIKKQEYKHFPDAHPLTRKCVHLNRPQELLY